MSNLSTTSVTAMTDLVEKKYIQTGTMFGKFAQQLYIVDDLSEHTGEFRQYNEIDPETFASLKPQGADAVIATVQEGYSKTMQMRRFAKEINITWEMRRLNKYPEVIAQLTSLAEFCPQRMEIDLTHRLTFGGDGTSYVDMDGVSVDISTGDGVALFSTTHNLTNGGTYSNYLGTGTTFTSATLEQAERLANTNILTNAGDLRVMNFDTIWTTNDPTLVNMVKQVLESQGDMGTDNSWGVVNVYKGKYKHIILPYLATTATGAYNGAKQSMWGIAALGGSPRLQAYLGIWEQPNLITPKEGNNGEDVHNDSWTYGTRAAYGICIPSPKGIIMGCTSLT